MTPNELESFEQIFQMMAKMVDDTQWFMWAMRRALLLQVIFSSVLGLITILNWWMLIKVTSVNREVVKLIRELIDKETR